MNENDPLSEEQIFNHFLDTLDGCEDPELQKRIQAQPDATTIFKGFETMHGQLQQMRVMTLTPGGISPRNNASLPEKLGNFKVLGKIGEGGMGIVLKAFDPSLGRVVAIKQLKNHKGNAPQQQRFQREAQTIARLKHDNIVQVYAFGFNDEEEPFIVMEYLQGQSLRREVDSKTPWTPEELQASWRPLLEALVHAHQKGILHRDIKPDNLLREKNNRQIKVVDFGISKWNNEDVQLTGQGIAMGTLPYMPPEQIRGESLRESGDIYSLAVTMAEMILGERPFKTNNPVKLLEEIKQGLPLAKLQNDSAWVNKIEWLNLLQDCCHPQAEKRPQGEDLLRRLREMEHPMLPIPAQKKKSPYIKLMGVALFILGTTMLWMSASSMFHNSVESKVFIIEDHSPYIALSVIIDPESRLKPELAQNLQRVFQSQALRGGYQWGQGSTQCQITCTTRGDRLVLKLQLKGPKLNFTNNAEQALVYNTKTSTDILMNNLNSELSKNPFQ